METQSSYIAELRGEIYKVMNGMKINHENLLKVEESCKISVEKSQNKIEGQLMLQDMFLREINEGMSQMFQTQMRNQAAQIEKSVAESVMKLPTNKVFIDNLSKMILSGMQKTLEQTFKKSLEEMIPSYEKISHEMLREVGKAFSLGTKEYTRAFEVHMKQYGAVQLQLNEFVNSISAIPLKTEEQIKNTIVTMVNRQHFDLKHKIDQTEQKILAEVRELVKNEIQKGFERQTVNLEESVLSVVQRSHTETPAPTIHDPKDLIRQYLRLGEINTAFHQALVTSDLALLDFTIENADHSKVFDPCPLEQSVLLSLIQQLTADMTKFNELKLK
jgi:enhancer of mRNA-decapping protein 4